MRACVLAIGMIALAQPAFARDLHKPSHHVSKHSRHHVAHARPHHRTAHLVRVRREAPIISGYSMPQSFARTDAVDSPVMQPSFPMQSQVVAGGFADAPRVRPVGRAAGERNTALDAAIARHAAANGLPVELVHRVVIRESRYNPSARNGSNLGLMQIKHATARGVGYTGSAAGLLDAETNLIYGVKYLRGAWLVSGGNQDRAVGLYAHGFYYAAKSRGMLHAVGLR